MKVQYRLSKSAEKDLIDIWDYTVLNWGVLQAENYLKKLESRFIYLISNPTLGQIRSDLLENLYSYHESHHFIYYRIELGKILIARVLHERMDYLSQLMDDGGRD